MNVGQREEAVRKGYLEETPDNEWVVVYAMGKDFIPYPIGRVRMYHYWNDGSEGLRDRIKKIKEDFIQYGMAG